MGLEENYKLGQQIYKTENYTWDGKSRPDVNDYIQPWSKYANMSEANSLYSKNRHLNAAIRYAKTQLNAALKQYDNDMAFWNEKDERAYTSPLSQSQRYEDAGYNMGYMYSSVDSGNSAVGYDQSPSEIENNDTSNKSVDQTVKIISTALNLATSLAKTASGIGVDITRMNLNKVNSDYLYSLSKKANAEQTFTDLQSSWFQYLREHRPDGSQVSVGENDSFVWSESLAYLTEKENYELTANQRKDLDEFLIVAADYYSKRNSSFDKVSPLQQSTSNIQNSDMPNWLKTIVLILAGMLNGTVSKSF